MKIDAAANAVVAEIQRPPQTPVGANIRELEVIKKKRAAKFKCVGSFCQAESCKTKAMG